MPQFQGVFRQPRQDSATNVKTKEEVKRKRHMTFRKRIMYIGDQPSGTFNKRDGTPSIPSFNTSNKFSNSGDNSKVSRFRKTAAQNSTDICTLKLDEDVIRKLEEKRKKQQMYQTKEKDVKPPTPKLIRAVTEINITYENIYPKQSKESKEQSTECQIKSDQNEEQTDSTKVEEINLKTTQNKHKPKPTVIDDIDNKELEICSENVQLNQPKKDTEVEIVTVNPLLHLPRTVCCQTDQQQVNFEPISSPKTKTTYDIGTNVTIEQNVRTSQTETRHIVKKSTATTTFNAMLTSSVPKPNSTKTKRTQVAIKPSTSRSTTIQTDSLRNAGLVEKPSLDTAEKCIQKKDILLVRRTNRQDKATQMYEYLTESELYCIEWIHRNLFDVMLNPYHLVPDERIKTASEMTCYTSEKHWHL